MRPHPVMLTTLGMEVQEVPCPRCGGHGPGRQARARGSEAAVLQAERSAGPGHSTNTRPQAGLYQIGGAGE